MGSTKAARRVLAVCCAMSTAWTSQAAEGSSQIAGGVLEWETVGDDVVRMRFEYPGELTYVAVGISEGTMPTTSAVLAQVNNDIREVDINGKSGGSVVTSSSRSTLANADLEVSGGTTVLSFEAASIGSRSFNLEGSDKIAVAWGDRGSFSIHQRRAVADVTWTDNVADETEPPTEDQGQLPSAEPTALDTEQTSSPTALPTPQPSVDPIAIVNSVDLLDGELNYKLKDDSITFDFDYPVVTGWISIAIGSSEQMVGGTAVVVSSLSSQEPEVEVYELGGKVSSQVTKIAGAEIDVKVSKNRGSTKLAFTTSKFGDQSLALDGSDYVMVARGSSEFFGIHDEFQGKSVTWRSGEADSFDKTPVLKAHAFFMVFGFLFIMPLATLPSVFRERYNLLGGEPQKWFTLHRKMQVISCLMVLLGFILAASTQTVHFDTPHKSLGGVIMIFVVIQPLLAVFFRKGCTRPFWQASHFIFAGVIFFGAVVTSLLGLGTFIATDFFRFLVFCGSTITIGCSIAVFINRMYKLCCDNGDATPNPEKN